MMKKVNPGPLSNNSEAEISLHFSRLLIVCVPSFAFLDLFQSEKSMLHPIISSHDNVFFEVALITSNVLLAEFS